MRKYMAILCNGETQYVEAKDFKAGWDAIFSGCHPTSPPPTLFIEGPILKPQKTTKGEKK